MEQIKNELTKKEKQTTDWKFYLALGGTTFCLLGGMYYLYSLFYDDKTEIELSQEQKEKIEHLLQLSNQINDSSDNQKNKIISEGTFALKVFKQINELSDEIFQKENPNWILERRTLLKDNKKNEYNTYCENILINKMKVEHQATDFIMQKLNIDQHDFQNLMDKIPQKELMDLQKELMLKQNNFPNKKLEEYRDKDIICAFKEFLKMKNEMDLENRNTSQLLNDHSEDSKMQFFIKLEVHKYMVDDYLFNLYDMDFDKLMTLISTRQLFNHPEISADYNLLMAEFNQAQ